MTYIRQSSAKASIYNIPAGWPFVDALAAGIRARTGDDPAELARVTVLLPTRRACRTLRDAFLRLGNGEALLLPRLSPIGDVDEDELLLGNELAASDAAFEVPPALPGLRRQLLLTRLVLVKHDGTPDQAIRLALELGRLLDEVYIERLSFDGLERLVPDDFSDHWQITLDFLKILTDEWPKILAEEGAIDYVDYRNQLLEAQARAWTETPPPGPVIAAGSTGSIPATADLLKTVAWLAEGAVVLPGLDAGANDDVWQNFGPHHPQFSMARLIEHIGVDRAEVALWPADGFADDDSRAHLINAALAPVDAMAAATEALDVAPAAFDGICRLDCPSPQDEAAVIALIMRQTLEQRGRTAALVTPNRDLARRVAAELRRWRIEIDDSAGT
ncbi:MAG: double-strand break repair protein AddB, partial [Rhodospirillales bacterium]